MPVQELRYDAGADMLVPVLGGGARVPYTSVVTPPPPEDPEGPDPALWVLDFQDDFNGSTLDTTKWNVTNLTTKPADNNWAMWRASNISVSGGNLRVASKEETIVGTASPTLHGNTDGIWPWTSGNIQTYGTTGSSGGLKYRTPGQYFRAEIRAKCPLETGFWPAPLWFRPNGQSDGEIDVYEGYSFEKPNYRSNSTLWQGYTSGNNAHPTQYRFFNTLPNPVADDWHTWVVEKTPNLMKFWVDGLQIGTGFTPSNTSFYTSRFETNQSVGWCPRITMQIKSTWSGADEPDSTTRWASQYSTMLVDYLRIWDYIGP